MNNKGIVQLQIPTSWLISPQSLHQHYPDPKLHAGEWHTVTTPEEIQNYHMSWGWLTRFERSGAFYLLGEPPVSKNLIRKKPLMNE